MSKEARPLRKIDTLNIKNAESNNLKMPKTRPTIPPKKQKHHSQREHNPRREAEQCLEWSECGIKYHDLNKIVSKIK